MLKAKLNEDAGEGLKLRISLARPARPQIPVSQWPVFD